MTFFIIAMPKTVFWTKPGYYSMFFDNYFFEILSGCLLKKQCVAEKVVKYVYLWFVIMVL